MGSALIQTLGLGGDQEQRGKIREKLEKNLEQLLAGKKTPGIAEIKESGSQKFPFFRQNLAVNPRGLPVGILFSRSGVAGIIQEESRRIPAWICPS